MSAAQRAAVIVFAIAVFPTLSRAQSPAPERRPPSILEFVEATYPPEARASGLEATVELLVTVSIDGTVADVSIENRVGNGFDEAAMEAVRRFRFSPATVDGVPTAARIRYRYVFELATVETPPDPDVEPTIDPNAPGRIAGRVLAEDERPIASADVVLTTPSGETRRAITAEDGTFAFDDLAPATYALEITAPALGNVSAREDVVAGTETAVLYRMTPTDARGRQSEPEMGLRAVIDPPPREVTRRTISRAILTSIPGTRGDALRAVEILPGVGRPAFGLGALIVRGSAPGDSEILLDGIPVPLLYHFGGLTSFMNSRLLERIDFYPGNFSSRYGRRMGGILEVTSRDPATDRLHGVVETSLIDASVLLEGPLTPRVAMAGSVRRSIIDLAFRAFVPDGAVRVTAAPVYYDYQLITTWRPTDRDRIKFRVYGSSDAFRLVLGDDASSDPDVRGPARLVTRFNFFHASWDRTLNDRTEQSIILQTGPTHLEFGLGDLFLFDGNFLQTYGRAEWRTRHSDHVRTIAGLDVFTSTYDIIFRGPPPIGSEGDPGNQTVEESIDVRTNGFVVRPGAYFDLGIDFDDGDGVLNIGTRLDYFGELNRATFNPRLATQWEVVDGLKLKAGVGLYSQPPEFQESNEEVGNPNLTPIHSLHTGLGFDYSTDNGISFGVEGFFKYLWNRVVPTADRQEPHFENGGIGRIYGTEISGRIDPDGRNYYGFLSYTIMRSERRDHIGDEWRLFDFDQTHIFTAAFSYRLPRHWEIGGTLRFVSGNPYTPVVGSAYDPVNASNLPINGMINSARNPFFNRLDIRIQKQWFFERWKLAVYLDMQNVYNRANQEGLTYSYDYSQTSIVSGLPIIPALGIRGEL